MIIREAEGFFCNEVTGPINCDFQMDYVQLYAQAWTLIVEGTRHYFDREDCKRLQEHNQRFMETDADMELFTEYYRKPEVDEKGMHLTAAQIAASIRVQTGINVSKKMIQKLARNLKSLHYDFRKYSRDDPVLCDVTERRYIEYLLFFPEKECKRDRKCPLSKQNGKQLGMSNVFF